MSAFIEALFDMFKMSIYLFFRYSDFGRYLFCGEGLAGKNRDYFMADGVFSFNRYKRLFGFLFHIDAPITLILSRERRGKMEGQQLYHMNNLCISAQLVKPVFYLNHTAWTGCCNNVCARIFYILCLTPVYRH